MNVGYLYVFNSFACNNGGAIHAHNLICHLTELGCTIHTFEPERNPKCTTYSQDEKGIEKFISKIDILYIRIDGWYLSLSGLKLDCIDRAYLKHIPICWEINAPAEERLKLGYERKNNADEYLLYRLYERLIGRFKSFKLKKLVAEEEQLRRRYAGYANGAICVSENLKPYAMGTLNMPRCSVVPNGSNPSVFSPDNQRRDLFAGFENYFKVIFSGNSEWPWQGFDLISHLAAFVRSQNHKILFIVLDGSASETSLAHDNLLILNRVNYTDVPSYISSADACLCLYHDFYWSSYGFYLSPLKLFDYMACGMPVIASNLGQIAEVIDNGRNGLLTANEIQNIFENLLLIMQNTRLQRKLGFEARKTIIEQYGWIHSAKKTYSVFKSIVSESA
jgi:glycosyltransferase involved in cell wall biosynthesis